MKKLISTISATLVLFALSSPLTTIAKSAEFFSIGTGGPTGVYFQVGNAVCKMVAKIQSAEHGRKKERTKHTDALLLQQEVLLITLVKSCRVSYNLV